MVGGRDLMGYSILHHQGREQLVVEMRPSITNDCSGTPETCEYALLKELKYVLALIRGQCNAFHPFADIVHSNQRVFVSVKGWE